MADSDGVFHLSWPILFYFLSFSNWNQNYKTLFFQKWNHNTEPYQNPVKHLRLRKQLMAFNR